MHIITVLACLIAFAASAPSKRRDDASADQLVCMYMTSDGEWQGEGLNICQYPGQCTKKLPDGLSKKASSAGPDQGAVCTLYSDIDCAGVASQSFSYPGYAELNDIHFNDRAMSWRCNSTA